MQHVRPGSYFVVVTAAGYLTPIVEFTQAELAHPTPEIAQHIAAVLQMVNVQPNSTAAVDVRLQHGGSLSGTVRFDDGAFGDTKPTTVRPYSRNQMPLSVHGDMTGVALAVKPQAAKPQSSAPQTVQEAAP